MRWNEGWVVQTKLQSHNQQLATVKGEASPKHPEGMCQQNNCLVPFKFLIKAVGPQVNKTGF